MAVDVYVTEFQLPPNQLVKLPAALMPAITHQFLSAVTTSTQSAAFNAATNFIRVMAVGAGGAWIVVGTNPTATKAAGCPLANNAAEYFAVAPGSALKLAAYDGVA